jgi:hypothetical protein
MSMSQVYVVDEDGRSRLMERIRCKDEDRELQRLLECNFDLLPGDQIEPDDPRRWLLIKREMPVPDPATGADRWSIDFLFVDQDATPTFVECKRCADTRARREVVGQMLEYAANGHYYWTRDRLMGLAEQTAKARHEALDVSLAALRPTDDLSVEDFFQRVEENLRRGQVRVVFFLEQAPFELRSVVDFLNKQMELSEVLVVEARLYEAEGRRIVAPMLFGYTEQARLVKRSAVGGLGRRRWDKDAFFKDAAARLTDADVAAITVVFDSAVAGGWELRWGTGKKSGSFSVMDPALCQRSLLTVYSTGELSLNFKWLNENDRETAVRDRFIALAVERLHLPKSDYRDQHKYLKIHEWRRHSAAIAGILRELASEFRAA